MAIGKLGFRVLPSPPRVSDELVARFRGLASSNLADAMGRFNFMDPGIQQRTGLSFAGPAVTNERGTYQAQITVADGVVTDVVALQAGTTAAQSQAVNSMAIPMFKERVLEAQTWDVEAVSGASFTSPAFLESLQGAFQEAGLPT